MDIKGKSALVTGATSGIGLATARLFQAQGARVLGAGRAGPRLDDLAALLGGEDYVAATDVADPADIAALMDKARARLGGLDILVANAGVSHAPPIEALTPEAYAALMDVNVRGAAFTAAYGLPILADGGSIVFVGSVAGRKGQPGDALYAGSKGFIRAFARNLGTDPELMRRGIRVNVVSPGPIDTPLTQAAVADPDITRYVEGLIPMGRWGRAEEVAQAILFLASGVSSFTTGAEITVDGGMAHA